ncbi:MAG: hypothetical protein IPL38_06285 [Rhodobacter sp.]|nr:hypothetical protein [Rhodobacter sp.]
MSLRDFINPLSLMAPALVAASLWFAGKALVRLLRRCFFGAAVLELDSPGNLRRSTARASLSMCRECARSLPGTTRQSTVTGP